MTLSIATSGLRMISGASDQPSPLIGGNIVDGLFGNGGIPTTQDRIPNAVGFQNPASLGTSVSLSNGWPAADFVCTLVQNANDSGNVQPWVAGTWKCGFTSNGSGTETVVGTGSGTVSNIVNASGHVTFDLIPTSGSGDFGFKVTGTTSGVTNIYAYLPGYSSNASIFGHQDIPLVTNEFITAYTPCGHQRSMQQTNVINNNTVMTSSNRAKPSNTRLNNTWAGAVTEAYPQEWFANFAKSCNRPFWMNAPFNADSTYYSDAFAGVAAILPNPYGIYIEVSNELWNGAGNGESAAMIAASQTYNSANPGVLTYDGNSSQSYLSYRFLAIKLHDIAVQLQTQFGSDFGVGKRVKLMFMTQGAQAGTFYGILIPFLIHQYGGLPTQWIQAIGSAPYYSRDNSSVPGDGVNHTNNLSDTTAQILTQLSSNVTYQQWLPSTLSEHQKAYALKYGMELWGYEGSSYGVDPGNADYNNANVGAAILDPAMQAITTTILTNLRNTGWDKQTPFSLGVNLNSGAASQPNYQEAKSLSTLSSSPRALAIAAFLASLPVLAHRNTVNGPGAVTQWVNYLDNVSAMSAANPQLSSYHGIENIGGAVGKLILCTSPRTYSVSLSTTGSTGTCNVYLNGVQIYTAVSIASTPAVLGNLTLLPGWNYIELGSSFNTSTLVSLTYT